MFLPTRRQPSTHQPSLLIKASKKPPPQAGQVLYVRVSLTASPPVVWIQRLCAPHAARGAPQRSHLGRSPSPSSPIPRSRPSAPSPRSSAPALGCSVHPPLLRALPTSLIWCSLRQCVIPSTSCSPALTCRSCSLRSLWSAALSCARLSPGLFPSLRPSPSFVQKNEPHP